MPVTIWARREMRLPLGYSPAHGGRLHDCCWHGFRASFNRIRASFNRMHRTFAPHKHHLDPAQRAWPIAAACEQSLSCPPSAPLTA